MSAIFDLQITGNINASQATRLEMTASQPARMETTTTMLRWKVPMGVKWESLSDPWLIISLILGRPEGATKGTMKFYQGSELYLEWHMQCLGSRVLCLFDV